MGSLADAKPYGELCNRRVTTRVFRFQTTFVDFLNPVPDLIFRRTRFLSSGISSIY